MTVAVSLKRRVRATFAIAVIAALVVGAAGAFAFWSLFDAREALVDRADPALVASSNLLAGLVDQETGVRAYVLAGDDTFLEPYQRGRDAEIEARAELDRVDGDLPRIQDELRAADRSIEAWRSGYADPTLAAVRAGDSGPSSEEALAQGRVLFDDIRVTLAELDGSLQVVRADARDDLNATTTRLLVALIVAAVVLVAIVGFLWGLIRRGVERPLRLLGAEAQQVAGGDLEHLIEPVGPAELRALGEAMEQMRQRIVDELASVRTTRDLLETRTADLERSNAELEQFAYVASHDLQEPLRKVASFCQLLQQRYKGDLDERADQYIEFAVDGAKRMQALINDLLAFSRVGRRGGEAVVIDADDLVALARDNLGPAIAESDAELAVGPLPEVKVEATLGVALFQNLIANAIKFHWPGKTPVIGVTARRDGDVNEFAVTDDGIGINPEYAERIFVIFQRLHAKDEYAGTGIGLALCRKIVEHHGGRIWVDTDTASEDDAVGGRGTTIRFTLPVVEGDA